MTGTILRQNTKEYFNSNPPEEAEIVFATDTDEIGTISEEVLIWQDWDIGGEIQYAYRGTEVPDDLGDEKNIFIQITDEIRKYIKENDSWTELKFGVDQVWVNENLEMNFHSVQDFPYLGKYSYQMEQGYFPSDSYDIVTKEYLQNVNTDLMKLDGSSEFEESYNPSEDGDVVTLGHLLSGDVKFSIPDVEPLGSEFNGALWNNNGVLEIYS